jgi:hypothetical protein
MATVINDNFKLQAPKPIESRYAKFAGGISIPYASVAEANSLIPMAYRYQGLTVLILENSVIRLPKIIARSGTKLVR